MKKLVIIMMFALGFNALSFAGNTNTQNVYSNLNNRNKTVILHEQGIEFIVYKNGSFDYAPTRKNYGSSVNIVTRNGNSVNIATNNIRNNRVNVIYDRRGRIARINDIVITYHRNNKVASIGNTLLDYKGSHIYVNNAYQYNAPYYTRGHVAVANGPRR